jgi:hypothetical protein
VNPQIQYKFIVSRSNVSPNDGAFMADETVAVALRTGSQPSNSTLGPEDTTTYSVVHYYGCGSTGIDTKVQIVGASSAACSSGTDTYQTNFKGLASATTYYADVWFKDVDGTWRLEGKTNSGTTTP